jgi:membrane protein implicated in regulation of membrane protease activity
MGTGSDKTAADAAPAPPPTLLDRFFLYGIRSVLVVVVLGALGIVLIVHGVQVGRLDFIASGAIVIVIGVVVGVAALRTEYTMITKKYFEPGTIIGKTGRAQAHIRERAKGAVQIEHETWSAIAEEDLMKGDNVIVTAVDPDKVTLRVRKQRP